MEKNLDYFEAFVWPFCEKSCLFCNEWWFGKRDFHSLEEFKNIIDKNNFQKVVLTGGEPMSNNKLEEYIKYCSEKNIVVWLVTAIDSNNYIKKIEKYILSGLSEIMISLEWPEKIHEILTQNKWSYKRIIEILHYLEIHKNSWLKVIIHSNINAINYKFLPKFIDHILSNFRNIYNYHLQMLEPFWSAYKHKKILFKKYSTLIEPIFQKIEAITENNKIKFWRLPLCLVKEKDCKYISQTPEIYEEHDNETQLAWYEGTKYNSTKCKECREYSNCDGFFEYYIKEYGSNEIIPFR
jgi:MoaA/NifB/PqqE/SkfB family radical SAM enzyme